jgi:branched-chain amino acid transport system ATP-binding protein
MTSHGTGVRRPALEVDAVHLVFGGVRALDNVSFAVQPGEAIGIVGSNGSGKSSLLNCVSGAYRSTSGMISLNGVDVASRSMHEISRSGVGRTFQGLELPRDVTALDAVLLGRHGLMSRYGSVMYSLGVPYLTRYERQHREAALLALEEVGCAEWAYVKLAEMPFGVVKRIDLARALAGEPSVLLLDEPAAGLGHADRLRLSEVVSGLASRDLTVLLVEHDMGFVSRVCPRLVVLDTGRVIYDGVTAEALNDPAVRKAFLGSMATEAFAAQVADQQEPATSPSPAPDLVVPHHQSEE